MFNLNVNVLNVLSQFINENKHALPENIVLMYPKVFFKSKFKISRKCQNKSVCVRKFLWCRRVILVITKPHVTINEMRALEIQRGFVTWCEKYHT